MIWTTFLQSPADFEQLSPLGFSHWLLEHSRFSLQAASQEEDPDFVKLTKVIDLLPSKQSAAFNLDLIALPEDFPEIERLLKFLQQQGVSRIRVQDFGLFHYLLKNSSFDLELDPHTGGNHPAWWETFARAAGSRLRVFHLPDQLSLAEASQLQEFYPGQVELLACGPLLMYHSHRQLFDEDEMSSEGWVSGREKHRPDQQFRWRTGPHGTLMYHNRWRWLLPEQLVGANMGDLRLLFDWRGAPLKLVETVMSCFQQPPADLAGITTQLKQEYGVEFTTPSLQECVDDGTPETDDTVVQPPPALVLHREGKKYLLLQAMSELDLHQEYTLSPPAGEPRAAKLRHPRDLNEEPVCKVSAGELFLIDSEAAIVPGSRLDRKIGTASVNCGRNEGKPS